MSEARRSRLVISPISLDLDGSGSEAGTPIGATPRDIAPKAATPKLFIKSNYPFFKRRTHFMAAEKGFNSPDGASYRKVKLIQKKFKKESSEERNNTTWYRLDSDLVLSETKYELHEFVMAAGEIMRFDTLESPKYRLAEGDDGQQNVISKKLERCEEFFEYFKDVIEPKIEHTLVSRDPVVWHSEYKGNDFYEGFARAAFYRWLYAEDDFHDGNGYFTFQHGQYYFVPIDFDHLFFPLVVRLHKHSEFKKFTAYPSNVKSAKFVRRDTPKGKYDFFEEKAEWMGEQTVKDFDQMPLLEDQVPRNWVFLSEGVPAYSRKVREQKAYQNEHHFSALKACLTYRLKELFVDVHVSVPKNNQALKLFLRIRFQRQWEICKASQPFKTYLKEYRISAIKLVFHEIAEFLRTNRHYLEGKGALQEKCRWLETALKETPIFLNAVGVEPISEKEMAELQSYLRECANETEFSLEVAQAAYEKQLMHFMKKRCGARLASLKEMKKEKIPAGEEEQKEEKEDEDKVKNKKEAVAMVVAGETPRNDEPQAMREEDPFPDEEFTEDNTKRVGLRG